MMRDAPGGRDLPSAPVHRGPGPGRLRSGSRRGQGETSKDRGKLVAGQGLRSIRWTGWNLRRHTWSRGCNECTASDAQSPSVHAPGRAPVRWARVHGTVDARTGAPDEPHRAHRMPGCPALPHRMLRTGVESTQCAPTCLHSPPTRRRSAPGWSSPCPLIPGGGPARCATGSAGRRETAVSGSAGRAAAFGDGYNAARSRDASANCFDGPFVGQVDDPPGVIVSQRPQHDQGRLRPEDEVDSQQRVSPRFSISPTGYPRTVASRAVSASAPWSRSSRWIRSVSGCRTCPKTSSICRCVTASPGGEPERGQTAPRPHPGRESGLLLGTLQRSAGRTAAVPEGHPAHVVPPSVPPLRLRNTDHPGSEHRL